MGKMYARRLSEGGIKTYVRVSCPTDNQDIRL